MYVEVWVVFFVLFCFVAVLGCAFGFGLWVLVGVILPFVLFFGGGGL